MKYPILNVRSSAALIAAAACWGIATVMTKGMLSAIPPITLLIIQLTFSISLLWIFVYLRGSPVSDKKALLKLGATGILNPGISYTLSLLGLSATTVTMSTLLWASEPVLILGLAWLMLRETLTLRQIIFSMTAMLGVVLIGGLGVGTTINGILIGNLLILGGVLCCALYTVLVQYVGSEFDPLLTVALQQTFALLWALLIWPLELSIGDPLWALLIWPLELSIGDPVNLAELGLSAWVWAGCSGIVYYALAFWLYLYGLKRVRASIAGAFINLIPFFGVSGAYLFLGERLSPIQWIGAWVILLSVFMILCGRGRNVDLQIATPSSP
jgi:drug/metabolite transporter (DMT)-like permease